MGVNDIVDIKFENLTLKQLIEALQSLPAIGVPEDEFVNIQGHRGFRIRFTESDGYDEYNPMLDIEGTDL